jgi:hypothetical protein
VVGFGGGPDVIQIKLLGDWQRASAITSSMAARFEKAQERAVLQEAHRLRGLIVQNITSGGQLAGAPFAGLSPGTLVVRAFRGFGGTKPLMVTGALRNSVSVVKLAGGAVFGGIRRGTTKGGKGGANLAELHEYGGSWTQRMTARQRRFLAAAYRRAGQKFGTGAPGSGMLRIRIPARPYVGPVVQRFAQPEDVKARFWANVSKGMGYDLGRP